MKWLRGTQQNVDCAAVSGDRCARSYERVSAGCRFCSLRTIDARDLIQKGFAFSQAFSGPGRSRQDTLTTLDSLQVYPATLSNATQVTFRCNSS